MLNKTYSLKHFVYLVGLHICILRILKIKSNHKNFVHLVGLHTYCKMKNGSHVQYKTHLKNLLQTLAFHEPDKEVKTQVINMAIKLKLSCELCVCASCLQPGSTFELLIGNVILLHACRPTHVSIPRFRLHPYVIQSDLILIRLPCKIMIILNYILANLTQKKM